MPLRCINTDGNSIRAYDLSEDDWERLKARNRRSCDLRMPCCPSEVVLKRSRLGTAFFAHKARGDCSSAPETEAHIALKMMAVEAARAHGWDAETEVSGTSEAGECWKADVLAEKGRHRVAVEIQWSGQSPDETMERQERYRRSGVRGLWLIRQPGWPITRDLPAACIGGTITDGFSALLPGGDYVLARDRTDPEKWHQVLQMRAFLDAAFGGRLRFGIPRDVAGKVSVKSAETTCWHRSCRSPARIITNIDLRFGPNVYEFTVADFTEHPHLIGEIMKAVPRDPAIGQVKTRFSGTLEKAYMSNGCPRCDRLFGSFFNIFEREHEEEICSYETAISEPWRAMILKQTGGDEGAWSVY